MPPKPEITESDPIIRALDRKQLMTYAELAACGAHGTRLRTLADQGLILSLSSGIYASIQLDPFVASVLATSRYYPQTVISGLTALQIHGLAQEFVEKIDVDISRDSSLRNKLLHVHRVPNQRLIGITELNFHGGKIRIYDLERSLCEAYRIDPAGALFFKALKRYVAQGSSKPDALKNYDQTLKTRVLSHLQQELADG